MTHEKLQRLFYKHADEYLGFDKIVDPPSNRPDLCAFLYIDKLQPGTCNLIEESANSEYYFNLDLRKLKLTENDAIYLSRCGVRYDWNSGKLIMLTKERDK